MAASNQGPSRPASSGHQQNTSQWTGERRMNEWVCDYRQDAVRDSKARFRKNNGGAADGAVQQTIDCVARG
jgi:hypothetical protein